MRRVFRLLGWGLLGMAGLVVLFLFYQLFVTDFFNARSQARAEVELETSLEIRRAELAVVTTTTTATTLPEVGEPVEVVPPPELIAEPPVPVGVPFGRIEIDKIGLDAVLFEGVDRDTLKLGPGHMPETPLPGQPGNAVVSGHRTTYGRPFFDVDQLVVGDTIDVETALGMSTYAIRQILVVAPTDVWVTDPIEGAWLTLTTCNPKFSAAERLIIQAELVGGPNLEYVQAMTSTAASPAA
ncbi:MAG TPA: sortase [Acidimicrobiia bacterium]|nr:sortase [Acidimicrobiia bacterium]